MRAAIMRYARENGTRGTQGEAHMAEQSEVRANREEVESFVSRLRDFHRSLDESGQAMLEMILDSAQGETGGYISKRSGTDEDWNDLVELLIDDATQGFYFHYETWRQRPEELQQEAERTSLIRRLKKARREQSSSPEDTRGRS